MYSSDNFIVLDCETTNLDHGDANNPLNRLLVTAWTDKDKIITTWGNELEQRDLVRAISACDFIVGHNVKFDLKWLARCGLDLTTVKVYDTQIAEYCLLGNERQPLDLGSVSVRYGFSPKAPFVDRAVKAGVCPSDLPRSMLSSRVRLDVDTTRLVFLSQRKKVEEAGLFGVVSTACRLSPCLADIEFKGLALDAPKVDEEFYKLKEEINELESRLSDLTGGINPNSTKQLGEFLYTTLGFSEPTGRGGEPERTASGKPKTDRQTISSLVCRTRAQNEFKEAIERHSVLEADLTKAVEKFKECCDAKDLLYANFNQCNTRTHRLSSSGTKYKVQFQNLHRKFKPLFRARRDNWLIGEVDGSQLEFRVAAFLGNDKSAISDIRSGVDVHTFTRDTITAAGQPMSRQDAKSHTFKPLYGGTSGTKAEQAYYKAFRIKYPGIAQTQDRWIGTVLNTKRLKTCTGLTFSWPDTTMQRSGYVTNRESICNYPVQYLATGEIIPIAVTYLWKRMRKAGMQSFITNTVHDSVVVELHPDEVELFKELAVQAFTKDVYNYLKKVYNIQFNVPLGCGIKVGSHWGIGEEEKHNVEPNRNS